MHLILNSVSEYLQQDTDGIVCFCTYIQSMDDGNGNLFQEATIPLVHLIDRGLHNVTVALKRNFASNKSRLMNEEPISTVSSSASFMNLKLWAP